ncbi:MAG TPA: type II toxin-antitoxin system VapC family toxin [Candidatus Sulfotelmatobacter sp.]
MTVYADSSFIVSLYTYEVNSAESRRLMATSPQIWFTPLHSAEWAHAMGQHVFQRKMSTAQALEVDRFLKNDRASGLWLEAGIPDHALEVCADLARRYGPRLGMRTLDSLHVACALQLKADGFWTFDERQAKLAKASGLRIL